MGSYGPAFLLTMVLWRRLCGGGLDRGAAQGPPGAWQDGRNLYGAFPCQADSAVTSSVTTKTTGWVDRLDLSQVKIADRLQRIGEKAVLEVRW